MVNYWTELSINYANQKSYLDDLYKVYPTIPNEIRNVNYEAWNKVEEYFNEKNNEKLIETLLDFKLFPIKDSYVAYLRSDKSAIKRNPQTINRLAGRLQQMGLKKIYNKCTQPKETNRQIGPKFKQWLNKGCLGIIPVNLDQFMENNENAILKGSDKEMSDFATDFLDYEYGGNGNKGLDFVGRFNNKYVIGEAKFLTDSGGHQNAQFNDALNVLNSKSKPNVMKIAILDGVLYINSKRKMYQTITKNNINVMSALVLNEFLYQI